MTPLHKTFIDSVAFSSVEKDGSSADISFNTKDGLEVSLSIPYETIGMLQTVLAQLREECTKRRTNEEDKPIQAHVVQGYHGRNLEGNDLSLEIYTVDKIPFHFLLSRTHAADLLEMFSQWNKHIQGDGLPIDKQIH